MKPQTKCCQQELATCFGMDGVPLSPAVVKRSLDCVSLAAGSNDFSLEEIQLFAAVRFTAAVEGYQYDEIAALYQEGKFAPSEQSFDSLQQIAEWWQQEIAIRTSKVELANSFDLRLRALIYTMEACHLPTKTVLYTPEQVEQFANARKLIERLHLSYPQVSEVFSKPELLQRLLPLCEQTLYTKMDLAREFQITKRTVRETLKHSGISLRKMVYSDTERLRFIQARELISRNVRYKDLSSKLDACYPDLDVDSNEDEICQFLSET